MKRFDKLLLGIICGLILPLLFGYLFIHLNYKGSHSLSELFVLMKEAQLMMKFMVVALIPDLFAIFLSNRLDLWNLTKGFLVSIVFYSILSFILFL